MTKTLIDYWNNVPVYRQFLPIGTRRCGERLTTGRPVFAVFHDTGNIDSTAQNNVDYFTRTYNEPWESVSSAHIFVDDVEAIVCIPIDEKAWHVMYNTVTDNVWYGIDANDGAFGLEACYFSNRQRSLKSLDNACRVMAALCRSWGINHWDHMPGHQDIQSDKRDPGNLLAACGYAREDMNRIDQLVARYL